MLCMKNFQHQRKRNNQFPIYHVWPFCTFGRPCRRYGCRRRNAGGTDAAKWHLCPYVPAANRQSELDNRITHLKIKRVILIHCPLVVIPKGVTVIHNSPQGSFSPTYASPSKEGEGDRVSGGGVACMRTAKPIPPAASRHPPLHKGGRRTMRFC